MPTIWELGEKPGGSLREDGPKAAGPALARVLARTPSGDVAVVVKSPRTSNSVVTLGLFFGDVLASFVIGHKRNNEG